MEAMLLESRSKLKELSKSKQSTNKKQAEVDDSLEIVEDLLSSIATFDDEEEEKRVWERNKRQFPDNKSIDQKADPA